MVDLDNKFQLIGDEPGEMGDALDYLPFEDVEEFITVGYITCVVSGGKGVVECFGPNTYDWMKMGDIWSRTADDPLILDPGFAVARFEGGYFVDAFDGRLFCAVSADGLERECWGSLHGQDSLDDIDLDAPIKKIECGQQACCALSTAGNIDCAGYGGMTVITQCTEEGFECLEEGSVVDMTVAPNTREADNDAICTLLTDGRVRCFDWSTIGKEGYDGYSGDWQYDASSNLNIAQGIHCVYEDNDLESLQCMCFHVNGVHAAML